VPPPPAACDTLWVGATRTLVAGTPWIAKHPGAAEGCPTRPGTKVVLDGRYCGGAVDAVPPTAPGRAAGEAVVAGPGEGTDGGAAKIGGNELGGAGDGLGVVAVAPSTKGGGGVGAGVARGPPVWPLGASRAESGGWGGGVGAADGPRGDMAEASGVTGRRGVPPEGSGVALREAFARSLARRPRSELHKPRAGEERHAFSKITNRSGDKTESATCPHFQASWPACGRRT